MYRRFPGQVTMPQPGQTLPPPISPGQGATMNKGGFGQGLARYMDAYRGERRAKKAEAERKFYGAIDKMFEQGLRPSDIDLKKMAKWAKEADLPFDFENIEAPPPPPPPQAQGMGIMPGGGVSPSPSGMPGGPLGTMNAGWPGGPANPTQAPGGSANGPGLSAAVQRLMDAKAPQRQSAEQAYRESQMDPATAQRTMMDASTPQRQAAGQAYMASQMDPATAQQGGQGRGIKNALRQMMGMPAPPSPAHEQGVMNMLRQIHERGAPSREAQQMQNQLALMGLRAQQQVITHVESGGTMDDPRIMPAMRILQLIGKGFPKDSPMGRKIAEAMAPEWAAQERKKAEELQAKEFRSSLAKIVTNRMPEINLDDIEGYVEGKNDGSFLKEAYGKKKRDAIIDEALDIQKSFMLEKPEEKEAARAFSIGRASGASYEELLPYIEKMGYTTQKAAIAISQQNADTSSARVNQSDNDESEAWMDTAMEIRAEVMADIKDDPDAVMKSAITSQIEIGNRLMKSKLKGADLMKALEWNRRNPVAKVPSSYTNLGND